MVIRKENIIMKKFYILISLFTFLLTGCEEDNLHLIDADTISLAGKFGVEPRKLLSHILEYSLPW